MRLNVTFYGYNVAANTCPDWIINSLYEVHQYEITNAIYGQPERFNICSDRMNDLMLDCCKFCYSHAIEVIYKQ